ncbi:hypothetical protein NMY22_g19077 [Coprinellus aureogranulatus]|nr:hypothetical protein NMY22_g19077 [Coprinellus aureogranulatus]
MAATVDDTFYRPANPFMDRLIDSVYRRRGHKRHRSSCNPTDTDSDGMAFFAPINSQQHLSAPPCLTRKRNEPNLASRHEVDDYLDSDDLEASFASNVSLNSPPRRSAGLPDCDAMDISPMPPPKSKALSGYKGAARPRALTANNSRLFGSDLSNSNNPAHPTTKSTDGTEAKKAGTTTNRKLNRSALPTEWMAASEHEPEQVPTQPSSPVDDAMDVDTSYIMEAPPAIDLSSPVQPAASGKEGFSNLFYDTQSPRRSFDKATGGAKKRRSLSPEGSPAMNGRRWARREAWPVRAGGAVYEASSSSPGALRVGHRSWARDPLWLIRG